MFAVSQLVSLAFDRSKINISYSHSNQINKITLSGIISFSYLVDNPKQRYKLNLKKMVTST